MDCPENITIKIEDSEEPVDNGTGVGDWNPFIQFEGKHEPISNSENCLRPELDSVVNNNDSAQDDGCIDAKPSAAHLYNIQEKIYYCNKCIFQSNSQQTMFQHFLSSHIEHINSFNNITNEKHPIIVSGENKYQLTIEDDIKPTLTSGTINMSVTLDLTDSLQKGKTEDAISSIKEDFYHKVSTNSAIHALSYRSETSTYECNSCSYITTLSSKALEHLKQDHKHSNYQCFCKKFSIDTQTEIEMHLNLHIKDVDTKSVKRKRNSKSACTNEKYHCSNCDFVINRKTDLKKHYLLVHIRKLFFCITCNLEFFSIKLLEDHIIKAHIKNDGYHCLHCGYTSNNQSLFLIHTKLHRIDPSDEQKKVNNNNNNNLNDAESSNNSLNILESTVYKCLHCTFYTLYKNNLIYHLQIHKNGLQSLQEYSNSLPNPTSDSQNTYKCGFCTFTSLLKKKIKEHVIETHSDKQKYYLCDLCGKYFLTLRIRKKHVARVHTEKKTYYCMHCKFSTSYLINLELHMECHTGQLSQLCYICGYRTAHQHQMDMHLAKHLEIKRFACNMCEYRTVDKSKLCAHLNKHTNERPYQCDQCPHRSKTKRNLKLHKEIHIVDKQLSCNICNFKCIRNYHLTNHMKMHSVEDRTYYYCKMCPKKFLSKPNLKMHAGVHLGIQYNCRFCNFSTYTTRSLNDHESRHSEELRMHCFYCNYSSTHRANFTEHVNKTCAKAKHRKEDLRCCYYCKYSSSHRSNFTKHVNGGCNVLKKILKMKKSG